MVRLFLILMFCVAIVAVVMILASTMRRTLSDSTLRQRPVMGHTKDKIMASSGIQKVAFVALIVILFGVASGWLGGL